MSSLSTDAPAVHGASRVQITPHIYFDTTELEEEFVRASGPGGQNVNKVATAVSLRWNVHTSTLPDWLKQKILERRDRRLTKDGVLVLSGQRFRTQERNREDVRQRLFALIVEASHVETKRIPTKPSRGATRRRLQDKTERAAIKQLRNRPSLAD
jgi:ribosome-associated protein